MGAFVGALVGAGMVQRPQEALQKPFESRYGSLTRQI